MDPRLIAAHAAALEHGDKRSVRVWRFDDAPAAFRALSGHGGDEDWVALVPPDFGWTPWLDSGAFAATSSEYELADRWTVRIGVHC